MTTYKLSEQGCVYETIEADSLADAVKYAEETYDNGYMSWDDGEGPIFVDIWVQAWPPSSQRIDEDGEHVTLQFDALEPECSEDEHDWQSPHDLVGGIEENPGVFGNGGGVIIEECCMHCGCKRTTDTWYQRPDTGEQGLTAVTYHEQFYELSEDVCSE